jgi:hypothetical protein
MSFRRLLDAAVAQQGDMDSRLRSAEAERAKEAEQERAYQAQKEQERVAEAAKQKQVSALENQISDYWNKSGIGYNVQGSNRANELARILQQNQIQNLSDLSSYTITPRDQTGFTPFQSLKGTGILQKDGSVVKPFSDLGEVAWQSGDYLRGGLQYKQNDYEVDDPLEDLLGGRFTLVSSAGKNGHLNYDVITDKNGKIQNIVPVWHEGSSLNFSDIAPALGLLAMPFTGGLSAALGGGLAGTIGANALIQGGLGGLGSLASGGDFLEGALKGGATGAFTAGIGSLVNPIASSIGADVFNATDSKFLSDVVSGAVKGVPGALMSGDASNLLTGAVTGAVGSQVGNELGLTPQQSQVATNIASKLLQGGDLSLSDIVKIGTSFAPGPAMPGTTGNEITEGFFDEDGPGFMPTEYLDDAEVDRELQSLLGRYPAPQPPSDWFLGENIASGIPEWDMAAVNAGLPIGNLEQDFSVAQTKEGPQIVDSAGNVGNFVNGEFVVDTGVTPNLSYAATSAPAPGPSAAPGKAPAPGPSPSPSPAPRPSVAPTPRSSEAQLTRYDPVLAQVDPYDLDRLFSIGR